MSHGYTGDPLHVSKEREENVAMDENALVTAALNLYHLRHFAMAECLEGDPFVVNLVIIFKEHVQRFISRVYTGKALASACKDLAYVQVQESIDASKFSRRFVNSLGACTKLTIFVITAHRMDISISP